MEREKTATLNSMTLAAVVAVAMARARCPSSNLLKNAQRAVVRAMALKQTRLAMLVMVRDGRSLHDPWKRSPLKCLLSQATF